MKQLIIMLLLITPSAAYAWGTPATARTTITANITGWTEAPCDFPEHQDNCVEPLFVPQDGVNLDQSNTVYSITHDDSGFFPLINTNYE